jgi:tRNA nucleotidyltransferase/poly(A) polymerase
MLDLLALLAMPEVALVSAIATQRATPVILVGGAVRDALLGKPVHDLDFAVQAEGRGTVRLARAVADELGGAFYLMDAERGTARVIVICDGQPALNIDFAACRGATWDDDLFGRDFSINAIALDCAGGALLDPTGGQADLAAGVIRQVTPHAISDDPVRALRAVRVEHALGALGAHIEPATENAVRAAAASLNIPSAERVRDELMKTLALPCAARAIRRLDKLGLLRELIPEIEPMRACTQSAPHQFPVLEHTFVVLDYLDEIVHFMASDNVADTIPDWLCELQIAPAHRATLRQQLFAETSNERLRVAVFRLAALLHDIAKPANRSVGDDGRIHFYGHEGAGSTAAAARARVLKLSVDEVAQIRTTVANHMRPNQMSRDNTTAGITPRAIYRYINATGDCAPEIALFCVADGMGKAGVASSPDDSSRRAKISALLIKAYYDRFGPAAAPKPLIGGRDVMGLGVKQGRQIGQILSAVREAQMVDEIDSYDAAIALTKQLIHVGD